MKLSDVKGERTLDVIADIIEPIINIAVDEDAAAVFKRQEVPEGMTARGFAAERIKKGVPRIIKAHRKDIITILASIEGVSRKKYIETMSLPKLTKDFLELTTDEEFLDLFSSAQTENSSGFAQENTGEQEA